MHPKGFEIVLFNFAKILAIYLPLNKVNTYPYNALKVGYNYIYFSVLAVLLAAFLFTRDVNYDDFGALIQNTFDYFSDTISFLLIFETNFGARFWNKKNWKLLWDALTQHKTRPFRDPKNKFNIHWLVTIHFVVSNGIILLFLCYNAYLWIAYAGFANVKFLLPRSILIYRDFIQTWIMQRIFARINYRFKEIDADTRSIKNNSNDIIVIRKKSARQNRLIIIKLREIRRSYILLNKIVDWFNDIFGWTIMLLITQCLFLMLSCSYSMILYLLKRSEKDSQGTRLTYAGLAIAKLVSMMLYYTVD